MSLIPVTILTGFLGSGKTTLLRRVLTETHGQKIAVIENEFGEENIDNEILISDKVEQIIQMNNGCVCCTIREDLRQGLDALAKKRSAGELHFDRVFIETTGLADPGPVAQTFFMDDDIAQQYLLDAIITIVDAKHAAEQLNTRQEARRQVGFADQIFISKADLVDANTLHDLQHRLHHMNPKAAQKTVHFGEVDLKEVLDLRGFNLNDKLEVEEENVCEEAHHHHEGCCHHEHKHHEHKHDEHGSHEGHHHTHHHHVDDDVKSFVFKADKPFDPAKLEGFLSAVVNIYGPKMLRYKGVLSMQQFDNKVIFQGVHQLMGTDTGPKWAEGEPRISKMVFIGIDLPRDILEEGLKQSLVV